METIGTLALVFSVLVLAWQSREIAKQSKISNIFAGQQATWDALAGNRQVIGLLFDRPEFRKYFYDGASPPEDPNELAQAKLVGEMICDVIESSLEAGNVLDVVENDSVAWDDYARFMLERSPMVQEIVSEHPYWFPRLHELTSGVYPSR